MKHLIAHFEDLDGLACHVVGERWNPKNIKHYDITYDAQAKPFTEITTGNHIIFCDLGYSKATELMLEEIRRHNVAGSRVDFYDHHKWDLETVQKHFKHIAHDPKQSSAQLLQQHLIPNDKYAKHIAAEARLDDTNQTTTFGQQLTNIIKSEYSFRKLIKDLAYTQNITEEAEDAEHKYLVKKAATIENLRDSYTPITVGNQEYIVGLADPMLYMKAGHRQIKADNPDKLTFVLYENTKSALFKTVENHFDIITSVFTGGGRDNEGGFSFPHTITADNYKSTINHLKTSLENGLKENK